MTRTELRQATGISPSVFARLSKGDYVASSVIDRICQELKCDVDDVEKTNGFNARLRELRNSVMNLLEKRYAGRSEADNVFYHKFILRFNPRVRYGIFLLSRKYVSDKYFIRTCTSSAYKGVTRLNKENLVPWVTEAGKETNHIGSRA